MYLPKHQYTFKSLDELGDVQALVDKLGNLVNIPGKNLIVTAFGEVFDRKTVDIEKGDFSKAEKLFPSKSPEQSELGNNSGYEYELSDTPERSSLSNIRPVKLPPSSKDKKAGIMKRCFYKNTSTGDVKEILKPQAVRLANNRERFEQVICIDWNIKGPAKDQTINGYFLQGIETKNQKTLDQLKDLMPGVEVLINGPSEYVEDTLIPNSDTINPQNNDLVIPSPGKRL